MSLIHTNTNDIACTKVRRPADMQRVREAQSRFIHYPGNDDTGAKFEGSGKNGLIHGWYDVSKMWHQPSILPFYTLRLQ